jgi:hypothetical protein
MPDLLVRACAVAPERSKPSCMGNQGTSPPPFQPPSPPPLVAVAVGVGVPLAVGVA